MPASPGNGGLMGDRRHERRNSKLAGRLLAALKSRLQRFSESDPSTVLDPAALYEASQLRETAASMNSVPQAMAIDILTALAYLHWRRYQVLPDGQDQDDLQAALATFALLTRLAPERIPDQVRDWLAAEPTGQFHSADQFTASGAVAFAEYQQTGRPETLEFAVTAFRDTVANTPPGDPDLATALSNLGAALATRFERSGDAADLDAAINAGQRAVDATPPGDPHLATALSNLGSSLLRRFERASDAADLDAAISVGQRAVDAAPPGDPHLAAALSNLENSLRTRFERGGDAADLDAAISTGQRAVDATPPGHPYLGRYLSNLGRSLAARFERAGDVVRAAEPLLGGGDDPRREIAHVDHLQRRIGGTWYEEWFVTRRALDP